MKKLPIRVLLVLEFFLMVMAFTSCKLIGNLFGGDDEDNVAVIVIFRTETIQIEC